MSVLRLQEIAVSPKISIVIPNLNCAPFLERTIRSAIDQQYPNLDLIMVDGGSTDGSLAIIEQYREHFSHVIVGPDTGQANALNKGFAVSTGEIMGWINSDDMLMPGGLHAAATIFADNHNISWIVGNTTLIDEQDNITSSSAPQSHTRIRFLSGAYQWIQQESCLWHRSLWNAAGRQLDESYRLAVDGELWLRFFQFERLYPVNVRIGSFRKREGQRSGDIQKYHSEMMRAIEINRKRLSPAYTKNFDTILAHLPIVRSRADAEALGPKIKAEDVGLVRPHADDPKIFVNPNGPVSPHIERQPTKRFRKEPIVAQRSASIPRNRQGADDLSSFRDKHMGKRCVVMGNGPSLNKMDLSAFRDEIVFAANSVFLLFDRIDWRPTYYACVDTRVLPDIAPAVESMHADNPAMAMFFPKELRLYDGTGRSLNAREIIRPAPNRYFFRQKNMDRDNLPHSAFSLDADDFLCTPNTVTITLMQLAYYMGFNEIYLIGCDTSYVIPKTVQQDGPQVADGSKLLLTSTEDDDPNHFDPRYFGKGRKWHSPKVEDMIFHYQQTSVMLEECGTRVFNATIGGNLECFQRIDYRNI
jgi:glycosyltransferase involved in cell wall biosynthesis